MHVSTVFLQLSFHNSIMMKCDVVTVQGKVVYYLPLYRVRFVSPHSGKEATKRVIP